MAGKKPSPRIEDIRQFVTPLVADTLFVELKEVSGICPPGVAPPAYGTAHPDTSAYPSYKLSLIKNADQDGLWQEWYYCKDRATQENYNAAITYPYDGNIRYPRYTRTYILPRAEGEVPLALGTVDPGTILYYGYLQPLPSSDTYLQPSPSTDTYLQPSAGTPAVLVAQSEKPIPVESGIGSLYVEVTRIFDVIPGSDDAVTGSGATQNLTGYTITRPLGIASFFRVEWKLVLPRDVADNRLVTDYAHCLVPGYESLVMIQETVKPDDGTNQTATVIRIYEGNIIGAAFPSADHVYYQGMFYPSNMPPDKFVVSKRKVVKTNKIGSPYGQEVRSPATSPETSAIGTYSRLESVEAKPSQDSPVLAGERDETYYTDIILKYIRGERWDDNLRDHVPYFIFVFPLDDYVAGDLGSQEEGTQRDITPLGTGWVMVTVQTPTERSIPILPNFSDITGEPRSYLAYREDSWPNVLYDLYASSSSDGSRIIVDYEFKPHAYNGPCLACIQVGWQKVSPLINVIPNLTADVFDPTSISINWDTLSVNIPECLHYNPAENSDGIYAFPGPSRTKLWEPTRYHTWPDSYIRAVTVEPYLGGWRIEKISVQKPNLGNGS